MAATASNIAAVDCIPLANCFKPREQNLKSGPSFSEPLFLSLSSRL